MQAYSREFARVFNTELSSFARRIAVSIEDFFSKTQIGSTERSVLDLCCGTGQLACEFSRKGYQVVGVDASEPMLGYARDNAGALAGEGIAEFVLGDILQLSLSRTFGLVTCTYDSVNHLENEMELGECCRVAYEHLAAGGYFVFDVNTRASLRNWNTVSITEKPNCLVISRGVYDSKNPRAVIRFSGCVKREDGLYDRFEQTIYNSVFDMQRLIEVLRRKPWTEIYFATSHDLASPIANPEMIDTENEVTIIARK